MTTFCLLEAVKTMISAMSSGVSGSQPLMRNQPRTVYWELPHLRINCIGLGFVAVVSYNGELLCPILAQQEALTETAPPVARGGHGLTVSTWPGSTSMTLIRVATSSFLRLSPKLLTAAFVAQ